MLYYTKFDGSVTYRIRVIVGGDPKGIEGRNYIGNYMSDAARPKCHVTESNISVFNKLT